MSYTNEQQQWMSDMRKKREIEKLRRLQQQYPSVPDYSNMSLQDELRTRFDMDEMKQLQQKYGFQQQTPVSQPQTTTPVPQTLQPMQPMVQQDSSNNWHNKTLNAMQSVADITEKGSLAFANGITLGNFDEAVGVIGGAVGAAKAYLNNQDLREGYSQGYQTVRDDIRNTYNQFGIEHPILNTVFESAGAFASPIKFFRYSKTAPLTMQNTLNKYNAMANGLFYGWGTGQDNWQNYLKQMAIGVFGNVSGYGLAQQALGRAASPAIRNTLSIAGGKATEYGIDGIQNQYHNYNKR